MEEQDRYQYPSYRKRYLNIPDGISPENHSLMKSRAENLLYHLKNYMKLGGLLSHSMSRKFDDGSTLFINSSNGLDSITYTAPTAIELELERKSTLVSARWVKSYHKIFVDFMGQPKRKYHIDLSRIVSAAHVRQPMGLAILEYDANYGVIFYISGTDPPPPYNPNSADNMQMEIILYCVTEGDLDHEDISDGYPRAKTVSFIHKTKPMPSLTNFGDLNLSVFRPPEYFGGDAHAVGYTSRNTYCYMRGGIAGEKSIENLVGEMCIEVGYSLSDPLFNWFWGIGISTSENDTWRVIDFNGSFSPFDSYYRSRTFEAYVTTPPSETGAIGPKWSIVSDRWEYVSETQRRKKVFICLDEEFGSSIEVTDLETFWDVGVLPYHYVVPGPGWPSTSPRVNGYFPGGGNRLGRRMMVAGKYMTPNLNPDPPPIYDYVTPVYEKKVYIINGVYYPEASALPAGNLLPESGKVAKELWEAKEYFKMRDKKTELVLPTITVTGSNYVFGYPTRSISNAYEGKHPDWPGETLTGYSIGAESYYTSQWDESWYVLTSFGCVRA